MVPFLRRPSRPQPKHLSELTSELKRHIAGIVAQRDLAGEPFVCDHELGEAWDQNRLLDLVSHISSRSDLDFIRHNLVKILSILVSIRWDRWSDFEKHFLRHKVDGRFDRLDANLPLADCSFLDDSGYDFKTNQYTFLPIRIEQGQNQEFSPERRLPFVHSSAIIGKGGFGEVTRCTIARGHFLDTQKPPRPNEEEVVVARKRFKIPQGFVTEVRNLDILRESLSRHEGVMIHLATLIRGDDFNIFFPLADLDLRDFIYEEQAELSTFKCPAKLVDEASNLAGALDFLHERIQIPGREGIYCIHMDLKPENIVVRLESSTANMRWMITDFGISTMKERPPIGPIRLALINDLRAPYSAGDIAANLTGVTPKRNPGPFQAPEVQDVSERRVSRKSDVWSLGCILSLVLVLALKRREGVLDFDQARREDCYAENYFYSRVPDLQPGRRQIWKANTGVVRFLDALPAECQDYDREWIRAFVLLILETLNIDIDKRPSATQLYESLMEISKLIKNCLGATDEETPSVIPSKSLPRTYEEPSTLTFDLPSGEVSLNHNTASADDLSSIAKSPTSDGKKRKRSIFSISRPPAPPAKNCIRTRLSPCGKTVALIFVTHVAIYSTNHVNGIERAKNEHPSASVAISVAKEVPTKFVSLNNSFLLTAGDREFILHQIRPNPEYLRGQSSIESDLVRQIIETPDLLEIVRTERLLDAVLSANGNVLLAFDNCLVLWRFQGLQPKELLKFEGHMQSASFSDDGSYAFAWTTPSDTWYIWDTQPKEPLLKYQGQRNMHRMGSPVQNLVPLGGKPAFIVSQSQDVYVIQENSARILSLKSSFGEAAFGRYVEQHEILLFVQSGIMSLCSITEGLGGHVIVGSTIERKISEHRRRACDIALLGDGKQESSYIIISFDDGSLECIKPNSTDN